MACSKRVGILQETTVLCLNLVPKMIRYKLEQIICLYKDKMHKVIIKVHLHENKNRILCAMLLVLISLWKQNWCKVNHRTEEPRIRRLLAVARRHQKWQETLKEYNKYKSLRRPTRMRPMLLQLRSIWTSSRQVNNKSKMVQILLWLCKTSKKNISLKIEAEEVQDYKLHKVI